MLYAHGLLNRLIGGWWRLHRQGLLKSKICMEHSGNEQIRQQDKDAREQKPDAKIFQMAMRSC